MSINYKIYKCRHCGEEIHCTPTDENKVWVKRSQGYYYHKKCWDEFLDTTKEKNDKEWQDLLFVIITHECHGEYEYHQVIRQFQNFLNKNMTAKGIYFTAYYHFVLKKNPWEKKYGIGIIPLVYSQANDYWIEQENKNKGIMQQIENNMKERMEISRKIKRQKKKSTLQEIDLF